MRMAKRIVLSFILIFAPVLSLGQQKPASLSNEDILQMTKGGLQESTIISAIQAGEPKFDLSVSNLLALRQAGVTDHVLDAMLASQAAKKNVTSATVAENAAAALPNPQALPPGVSPEMMANLPPEARQQITVMSSMSAMSLGRMGMSSPIGFNSGSASLLSPEQMPTVTLISGSDKKPVATSMTQIATSTTKGGSKAPGAAGSMLSSLASEGLSFAAIGAGPGAMMAAPALGMMTGMFGHHHGMPTTTYVWALPNRSSSLVLPNDTPKFELHFADIVGLDPDSYQPVIVSLKQSKDNWRLVGATKAKMTFMQTGESESMIDEARMPVKVAKLSRGVVAIEAASPLPAGEYGIVLRPADKHKKKKGQAQSSAEQALFYSVWDFSVAGNQQQSSATK